MTRKDLAQYITAQLQKHQERLASQYAQTKSGIGYFVLDDLLPESLVLEVYKAFPVEGETVIRKKNFREFKHVAYQMDAYENLLEELIYAFQEPAVVQCIGAICEKLDCLPDQYLYAGGLSVMKEGNYLHPHLDNSHDKDRNRWRVFNLLYYVSPDWALENGGNLELWPAGVQGDPITLVSRFNRLVVMATHDTSWHSVSKVAVRAPRCCVSNYYFSEVPIHASDRFHITTFRARPGATGLDFLMRLDNGLRNGLRSLFKKGVRENPHQYKRDQED
ncbi:2OG-Fe(II) oxygenase [Tenacibaculum litopenaei]|uniref:2OG-Fe(II) oxygenase n=1 Tax=Tenacibaculum litopenaei TaxID=396016 RepID=UPI003895DBAF